MITIVLYVIAQRKLLSDCRDVSSYVMMPFSVALPLRPSIHNKRTPSYPEEQAVVYDVSDVTSFLRTFHTQPIHDGGKTFEKNCGWCPLRLVPRPVTSIRYLFPS